MKKMCLQEFEIKYKLNMHIFSDGSEAVELQDVIIFTTGADRIPTLGFSPTPTLNFHKLEGLGDESCDNFPFGNTCRNIFDLPLITDYEKSKTNFMAALSIKMFTAE